MFFIAAALVLTTAGVFAGKAKFTANPPNLYYRNTVTNSYVEFATAVSSGVLEYNTGGTQLTISGGTAYPVYTYITGGTPLYQQVEF